MIGFLVESGFLDRNSSHRTNADQTSIRKTIAAVKAISIQQPWAWAILHAGKDVENRSWSTPFRGEVAIHATRMQDKWRLPHGVTPPAEQDLVLRAVIGLVDIADVVGRSSSKWFFGPCGFVLRNPRPLDKPVHCPGNQRIWELPASVAKAVQAQLTTPHPTSMSRKRHAMATRFLTVTQGNIDNNHLYLREALDLFPADVLGGARVAEAGRPVQVHWGEQCVETDVVRQRQIFRRRGWMRQFFAVNQVKSGERVLLEQLGPYVYRLSKVEGQLAR
jgi:hypothetical protein